MPKLNQTDFAKEVGASKVRIHAAIKSGILSESVTIKKGGGRGGNDTYEIDLEKGKREWAENRDISRIPDSDKAEAARDLAGDLKGEKKGAYAQAKTMGAVYDAQMKKLEYGMLAGTLVKADEVKAAAFKAARGVRDAILNLPGRVAPEIANMTDAHTIEIFLLEKLSEALEELGNVGKRG